MGGEVGIIQTTLPGEWDEPLVGEWSSNMIADNLAACVQRSRVKSVFRWEGKLESTEEWRIQLKTSVEKMDDLVIEILSRHPYDTPQVVSWVASSTTEYASWVEG